MDPLSRNFLSRINPPSTINESALSPFVLPSNDMVRKKKKPHRSQTFWYILITPLPFSHSQRLSKKWLSTTIAHFLRLRVHSHRSCHTHTWLFQDSNRSIWMDLVKICKTFARISQSIFFFFCKYFFFFEIFSSFLSPSNHSYFCISFRILVFKQLHFLHLPFQKFFFWHIPESFFFWCTFISFSFRRTATHSKQFYLVPTAHGYAIDSSSPLVEEGSPKNSILLDLV